LSHTLHLVSYLKENTHFLLSEKKLVLCYRILLWQLRYPCQVLLQSAWTISWNISIFNEHLSMILWPIVGHDWELLTSSHLRGHGERLTQVVRDEVRRVAGNQFNPIWNHQGTAISRESFCTRPPKSLGEKGPNREAGQRRNRSNGNKCR